MFECFTDTLAVCNLTEAPNALTEISAISGSNTTFDEQNTRADTSLKVTVKFAVVLVICIFCALHAIYMAGFTFGKWWHPSDVLAWLNANIFNPKGFTLSMVAGRPVFRPMVAGGANQPMVAGGYNQPIVAGGANLPMIAGVANLPMVAGGAQGQGPAPKKIKRKKRFLPPMCYPASRTPHIPRN